MALLEILALAIAIGVLAKASNVVVTSATHLADYFRIGQMAVGFLLISVSTSLPELMVSVISGSQGHGGIAVGNVFGSNIANVLLVLGIGATLYGIRPKMREWKEVALILLAATFLTVALIYVGALHMGGGILLFLVFALYAWYLTRRKVEMEVKNHVSKKEALTAFLLFAVGMAVVLLSAGFVVHLAVVLAEQVGLAKSFIGATIIAIGTSLPELVLDLQALRAKKYGLALGDAIGSSMSNITLVLGAAALLNPIALNVPIFVVFMAFSILANGVLLYFILHTKKLDRRIGVFFLLLYAFYLLLIFNAQLGELAETAL